MILSDRDILARLEDKDLVIDPFISQNLQPSSVDLTLSSRIRIFDNYEIAYIDIREKTDPSRIINLEETFIIHPGEFVLGSTIERFTIPKDLAAKLEGRSSLGRLGLIIHATAGFVDPGFKGYLTLEISNISRLPIKLYAGMRIAQIAFLQMTSPVINPYGSFQLRSKYQGQEDPTSSKIWEDFMNNGQ